MEKTKRILLTSVLFSFAFLSLLYAHSGRTDSSGGHTDRKTGIYHYHNSGTRSTPARTTPSYTQPSTIRQVAPQRVVPAVTPAKPAEAAPVVLPDWDSTPKKAPAKITENLWQVALNNVLKGQMEVPVKTGRVDIVTESQVIEVDKLSNYAAGLEQAVKYAVATGKTPTLALYIDGEKDALELLSKAGDLCKSKGVTLMLVNSYVTVSDLIALAAIADRSEPVIAEPVTTTPTATPAKAMPASNQETGYWLNSSSNVRHNSACRYYFNTNNGRKCTKDEGRPCGICGG